MTSRFSFICAAALVGLSGFSPSFAQSIALEKEGANRANSVSQTHSEQKASSRLPFALMLRNIAADSGVTGGQGNLLIDPITVNFGGILVGSLSDGLSVTLSNNGTASLDVSELGAATGPFARSGGTCSETLPITIAVNDSCTLGYIFGPSEPGFAEQTLTVTANAPGSGNIELVGSGIQGHLTIDPASIDFGNVLVGGASGEFFVQLANDGTASLNVTSLTAASEAFARTGGTCSEALPITIAASGFCTLHYTFSPQMAGVVEQTIAASADAPGGGSFVLGGTGVLGNLVIDPVVIDFDTISVGAVSDLGSVTLSNVGTGVLNITSLTVAIEPFARTNDGSCGNKLPFSIAGGASCTLTYVFAPTELGTMQQSLLLESDAAGDTGFELSGKAVPEGEEIFSNGFESIN